MHNETMEKIREISWKIVEGTQVQVGAVFQVLCTMKDPESHGVTLQELRDQLWRLRQKLPIRMPKVLLALVHAHGKPWDYQNIDFVDGYRPQKDEERATATSRPT